MNLLDLLRDKNTDTTAFARLVFLWLTDSASMGSTFASEAVSFYNLTTANIATLDAIKAVYDAKGTNLEKLHYALTVKTVIELVASRDNNFKGRTFPITASTIQAVLEI